MFQTQAHLFVRQLVSHCWTAVRVRYTVLEHVTRSHAAALACCLYTCRSLLGTRSRSTVCDPHAFVRFPAIQGASLFGRCQYCTSGVSGRLQCETVFVVLSSVTVLTCIVTDAQHGTRITRREPHRPHLGTPRYAHTRTSSVTVLRPLAVRTKTETHG